MSQPTESVTPPQATNLLGSLIDRVRNIDPSLADDLRAAIKTVTSDREFGLVFNRHLPETVELPGRTVRARDKVRIKDAIDGRTWRVGRVRRIQGSGRVAELVSTDAAANIETRPLSELVVVADFRDPIYPGFKFTHRIDRGGDKPAHVVINAENYHALEALTFAYTQKLDCIYIDPPYNTGGDLVYNDKRVSGEDGDKHAKWLSFLERRLRLAKRLLKPTGVIIVAIDDNEHAHLKLLMSQVFGEQNFVANVIWQGARKNDPFFLSVGHDYMLIYARSKETIERTGRKWREQKPGVHEVLAQGEKAWQQASGDQAAAEKLMRQWFRSQPITSAARALSRNVYFLPDGTLCSDTDMRAPEARENRCRTPITNPRTGKVHAIPANGWFCEEVSLLRWLAEDRIVFRDDPSVPPRLKKPLIETQGQIALSIFERGRIHAGRQLQNILGEKRFDFPKDPSVLARWINLVTGNNSDAVILDFFAGSGSTGQAVMELNAADDGRRQCILVTNNELNDKAERRLRKEGHRKGDPEWEAQGIFERVTLPRIKTVVTGVREDGSKYSDGLNENVEFLALTYEDPEALRLDMAFEAVAPLLWLRAGGKGSRIDSRTDTFDIADHYGVLFNPDHWWAFVTALKKADELRCVYVVTDDDNVFQHVTMKLPGEVSGRKLDVVRLYENYLTNFEINRGLG